jgi:hypothetical protein
MVRTQYYSEDIDADGGLFPPERMALIYGIHPPRIAPSPGEIYVMSLDIAGEDEKGQDGDALTNPARDATAVTIARVNTATLTDPGLLLPSYEIVYRQLWVGIRHTDLYGENPLACHDLGSALSGVRCHGYWCRADGFPDPFARPKGDPFVFNRRTKSDLGWSFLS